MASDTGNHTAGNGGATYDYEMDNRNKSAVFIDDIFTQIRFGIFNYFLVLVSGIILGAVYFETCAISFVIPVSECDLSLTMHQKGILGGVAFIGIICSSHLWGFLADTQGRRVVIMPTLMIPFILSVLSTLTNNFYILAVFRFFNGFFISGSSATIYAYLGEFHNDKQRSRAIMGSAIIYGVMCLSVPLLAWLVINQDWSFEIPLFNITYRPWRLFIIVCSLPGFLASIALIFLPESPKFVLGQGKQMETIGILKKVDRWNNRSRDAIEIQGICEEAESIENRQRISENKNSKYPLLTSIWSQTAPLFKPPYLEPIVLICIVQFGIYATSNGFYMFFPDIMNRYSKNMERISGRSIEMCDVINMDKSNTTEIIRLARTTLDCNVKIEFETLKNGIILEIIYVVGYSMIGVLINHVGKFFILLFLLGFSGVGGIVCVSTGNTTIQIYSFLALMSCGMAGNVVSAAAVEIFPTSSRAMAICIALMFGRLGSVAGSNLAASLLNDYCRVAFYSLGSSILVCAVLTFFIPTVHQRALKEAPKCDRRMSTLSMRF